MSGTNANDTRELGDPQDGRDGFDGPPASPPKSTRPGGFTQAPPPPTQSSPAPSVEAEAPEVPVAGNAAESTLENDKTPDGTAADVTAVEVLRGMFETVLTEADRNPRFAEALISALPEMAVVDVTGGKTRKSSPQQSSFDPHSFSLVATYQKQGEEHLREKLDTLTKDQIIKMADAQSISLSNTQKRKRKAMIISATLKATNDRLADRFAASG